jgi:hypothetical protein
MSYVLHVWEGPEPTALAEAVRLCSGLLREARPANPKFAALVRQLTERFPDIDTLDEDEDPGVWTDGPLARNALTAVFSVGVQTHALDTVVPFVVEVARSLGLIVLDEQAGQVCLPDGRILGGAGSTAAHAATAAGASKPITRLDVLQALNASLGPLLSRQGFKPLPKAAGYRWPVDAAVMDVRFESERRAVGQQVSVTTLITLPGRTSHPLLQRYYPQGTDFLLDHSRLARADGLTWPDMVGSPGGRTDVANAADLDRLCQHWVRVFEVAVLPLLQRCASLEGLAREMAGNMPAFRQRPVTLVLAATVEGLDLGDVAQRLAQWIPPHVVPQLETLLAELRQPRGGL